MWRISRGGVVWEAYRYFIDNKANSWRWYVARFMIRAEYRTIRRSWLFDGKRCLRPSSSQCWGGPGALDTCPAADRRMSPSPPRPLGLVPRDTRLGRVVGDRSIDGDEQLTRNLAPTTTIAPK